MRYFICPVCGESFTEEHRMLKCRNGHCFDLARQGYVNLLRSQKSSAARHGDDKMMVSARTAFLDAGYYAPLREKIGEWTLECIKDGAVILDAGCGEGYYTSYIRALLQNGGLSAKICGMDISKEAVLACAKRDNAIELAVASVFAIPAANDSADLLLNLFAPDAIREFSRILRDGAVLFRAYPGPRHLWELKKAVYEHPYENETGTLTLPGFELYRQTTLHFPLVLDKAPYIQNLFRMTPYYYKTSKEDQQKLSALSHLETEAEFTLVLYQKT